MERILEHSADTRSLFLRTVTGRMPFYSPGMFISVKIPLPEELRIRPYTIATSPEDGEPFELIFNLVPNGRGAAWMFERKVGDLLDFTGPFGAFTLERAPDRETVFIAEGTAVAPIRPMLRRALSQPCSHSVHFIYAAAKPERLLYRAEFESLAVTNSRFRFEPLIVQGKELYESLSDEVARRWVHGDGERRRDFFLCGIGSGVLKLRDLLRGAGYERRAIHYERW